MIFRTKYHTKTKIQNPLMSITMTKPIDVIKRDGTLEQLDINKIHTVLSWACEGLSNVSVSDIEMNSKIQFYNKIKSSDIHNTMIKAAADLIDEEYPNYQYVASRLLLFSLRKQVLGQYEPIPVKDLYLRNVELGLYDNITDRYSDEEWAEFDTIVDHERDFLIAYAGMKQLEGKYLVQDRVTKEIFETPQYSFIMIAANVFINYSKDIRMSYVKKLYDNLSKFNISLPTPIMAGVRTPSKQYSSCVLLECADSLDSITATSGAIIKYISQKAGIGIGAGSIRAEGSSIDNGRATHTGNIPFFKLFESSVKSCSQGAIRGGSATLHTVIWHLEIEDILVLKNNKGTPENRVRKMDYSIQYNGFILTRLLRGEKITLFSPHDVPDLYDAFFDDQDKFAELYVKYENNKHIRKKRIDANELITTFLLEQFETGRLYNMFTDHANTHSSFLEEVAPIKMSNLCQEITLPTKPFESMDDTNGQIALCILAAINLGNVKQLADMEEWADICVRTLDELIDIQDYPLEAARISTVNRRSLGVGVINYAYYLAKNSAKYDESGFDLTNKTFEAYQYYLLKASVNLAKEKGKCNWFDQTKYSKGILPIDTYKSNVDELVGKDLQMDWEWLRKEILTHGLRNSTLSSLMPSECQLYSNKLNLADGRRLNFHELLDDVGVDWESIETSGIPQRYSFLKPIVINTQHGPKEAFEYYYNGFIDVIELEFDDGETYGFTPNHKLLVLQQNVSLINDIEYTRHWEKVGNLTDGHLIIFKSDDKHEYGVRTIRKITHSKNHTWDISVLDGEEYILPNGIISHNTSSQISNATNGIEPVLSTVTTKGSKNSTAKQVVPEVGKLKNKYDYAWNMRTNDGYIKNVGIMQKYIDQAISANKYYNPEHWPDGKIPMDILIKDFLNSYKYGHKTAYYSNTYDGRGESEDEGCEGGACKI
jgi:ribonucleoside-diphosphate reductase alpha chain